MAKNNQTMPTYQEMSAELDQVLTELQSPDLHIDDAANLYERGLQLVQALEARIKEVENKIIKLKIQADERET